MKFIPYSCSVEVEPISSESVFASDEKNLIECARVIQVGPDCGSQKVGDIIFFRPHGFFETPEYEGKKHYVVKVDSEFVLGKLIDE